jgi:APA family basic amino acid/polyamine antiporter
MVSYVLLNFVFMKVAPIEAMQGKIEIGMIAADYAFGEAGGQAMGITLSMLLISTVSAMLMAGPRVLQVIGQDFRLFGFLAKTNKDGIPMTAILAVAGLSLMLVLTSSFESVLVFSGFVLALNTFFAVAGVFILRFKQRADGQEVVGYQTWGYPVTPILYLGLTAWTLVFILLERPKEALAAGFIILLGLMLYWLSERLGTDR